MRRRNERPGPVIAEPPPLNQPGVATSAIAIFVMFGLADAMLGAAWPAIRADLGLRVDALGVLLVSSTAGFLITSTAGGRLAGRFGARAAVLAAAATTLAGSLTIAVSQPLVMLAAGALVLGGCGGVLDSSLSTLASVQRRPRLMNLLHGGYGLGAALAPLLVTAAVTLGSWRGAYVALAVGQGAISGWWAKATGQQRDERRRPARDGGQAEDHGHSRPGRGTADDNDVASPWPVAVLGVVAFFFVGGLEMAIGAWAATYLSGLLGLSAGLTGVGVFSYWASLTASRIAAGAIPHHRGPRQLALTGCAVAVAGTAMLWWRPDDAVAVVGLIVAGLGTGPVFPALTSLTPARVGRSLAPQAIGWQLGSAAVGTAVLSSLVGVGLQHGGLGLTGPLLTGLALIAGFVTVALDCFSQPIQRPREEEDASSAARSR